MLTLKVLSLLIAYPREEIRASLPELAEIIDREGLLPGSHKAAVLAFMKRYGDTDLMDLQERYVSLFDRGRHLSLHLFEHVHGESRDRGQAMVDLMALYQRHGFEIGTRELPDYIPMFLEFLSQIDQDEARRLLADAMHIVGLIGARLVDRESEYGVLFEALEGVAGPPEELEEIRRQVAAEGPDEALVNMDKIWEDEAVTFLGNGDACQTGQTPAVQPVRWVRRPGNSQSISRGGQ